MFNGIKSVIYPSSDLQQDTAFWTAVTGIEPYFTEAYYVGFSVAGAELGLDPNAAKEGLSYPVAYWHVAGAKAAQTTLIAAGAVARGELRDVGGGMLMGTFTDKSDNIFGIIENPNA